MSAPSMYRLPSAPPNLAESARRTPLDETDLFYSVRAGKTPDPWQTKEWVADMLAADLQRIREAIRGTRRQR